MKKRSSIIIVAFLLLLLAVNGIFYLLSLKKTTFSLENTDSITIYNEHEKSVGSLTSNGDVRLQKGTYYVIPEGEDISKDRIEFEVKEGENNITINPSFTDEHLQELLKEEMPSIIDTLTNKYPSTPNEYAVESGTLFGRGEWFGGLLSPKVSDPRDLRDPYRVVLHKNDGNWEVVRRPEYILTASRYKDVPIDILREINLLAPQPDI